MHTAESNSEGWCRCTPQSFLKIWISRRNRNRIRKYFSLFIRGPDGFESWKKTGGWKSRDTLATCMLVKETKSFVYIQCLIFCFFFIFTSKRREKKIVALLHAAFKNCAVGFFLSGRGPCKLWNICVAVKTWCRDVMHLDISSLRQRAYQVSNRVGTTCFVFVLSLIF